MPILVCTGASLSCSYGDAPATFSATGDQVSADSPAGVVDDVGAASVPTFGMCQSLLNPEVAAATDAAQGVLTPQPCQPVLSPWMSASSQRVTIGGLIALDSSCRCMCAWQGQVTVTDPGQDAATIQ